MEILLTVIFALTGIAVGSFLNVVIDRLPAGRSLVSPPSHCDKCQHRLSPRDLIPVVSYLWLRGRCRYCGVRIPWRSPSVELASGILFVLSFFAFGLTPAFIITVVYCSLFLVIMMIDLEHKIIMTIMTYPTALITLILLLAISFLPMPDLFPNVIYIPEVPILSGLIGAASCYIFFLVVYLITNLIYKGGFGYGDVTLAGLIGLIFGFPMGIIALFVGIFIGGLFAIVLLIVKRKRRQFIPYGTFLGFGPIIILLWGNDILTWYLGFF